MTHGRGDSGLHVALVCPYDLGRFGGVQDQVLALAGWLADAGHGVRVVGPGDTGPEGAVLVGPVRVVRANRSEAPVALGAGVWRRVAAAIADVDVVHVHEPLVPMVSIAALITAKAPVVATLHADASAAVRRGMTMGRPMVRRLLGRAAVVTAVSPTAASVAGGAASVRLVPNGIDLARWDPASKRPGSVVFVGRDDARKGLGILLAAWPAVTARMGGATLDVIGAERAGLDSVTFHGRVDEAVKRRLMGAAEVLVAPNTAGESFGVILVEAMAAGCAMVASALPGFVHVAGEAARWVAPGDVDGLAAAVAGVLAEPSDRDALVERGTARVVRFDRDRVLAGYLEAYREAVALRDRQ